MIRAGKMQIQVESCYPRAPGTLWILQVQKKSHATVANMIWRTVASPQNSRISENMDFAKTPSSSWSSRLGNIKILEGKLATAGLPVTCRRMVYIIPLDPQDTFRTSADVRSPPPYPYTPQLQSISSRSVADSSLQLFELIAFNKCCINLINRLDNGYNALQLRCKRTKIERSKYNCHPRYRGEWGGFAGDEKQAK